MLVGLRNETQQKIDAIPQKIQSRLSEKPSRNQLPECAGGPGSLAGRTRHSGLSAAKTRGKATAIACLCLENNADFCDSSSLRHRRGIRKPEQRRQE